jgi:UDP-N-acetylmuramoylalanine--D-glutamate ligase
VKDKVKSAVLIGETAKSIRRAWDGAVQSEIATSLADAVERSRNLASAGDVVLFSPGTSSFDMFKSYADRGDQFRKLVQTLPQ